MLIDFLSFGDHVGDYSPVVQWLKKKRKSSKSLGFYDFDPSQDAGLWHHDVCSLVYTRKIYMVKSIGRGQGGWKFPFYLTVDKKSETTN